MIKFLKKIRRKIINFIKGPTRYSKLFREIKKVQPKNIMEVGTWNGNRAFEMIKLAQRFNKKEEINYYGFDLFEEMNKDIFQDEISKWPPSKSEVELKLKETGSNIFLYKGNTTKTLPENVHSLPIMDFVFIDGGHHLETVKNDWENTEKLMNNRTVVIFDDYWPERADFGGSKKIVDGINTNLYNVEILKIVDKIDNKDFGKFSIQLAKVTKK